MDALKDVPNLAVYPSATNVLVRVPDGPAIVKALHDTDIYVRSYKAADLKNCLPSPSPRTTSSPRRRRHDRGGEKYA